MLVTEVEGKNPHWIQQCPDWILTRGPSCFSLQRASAPFFLAAPQILLLSFNPGRDIFFFIRRALSLAPRFPQRHFCALFNYINGRTSLSMSHKASPGKWCQAPSWIAQGHAESPWQSPALATFCSHHNPSCSSWPLGSFLCLFPARVPEPKVKVVSGTDLHYWKSYV